MTGINKFFDENRSSFEIDDMPSGHLERFDIRLNSLHDIPFYYGYKKYFTLAASVVLFIAGLSVLLLFPFRVNQTNYLLTKASPEIQEAERFYKKEIEAKIKIISLQKNTNKSILSDFEEMNDELITIHKDILKNPNDSRIVSAVLNTYITQIEWLDGLIEQTNRTNTTL